MRILILLVGIIGSLTLGVSASPIENKDDLEWWQRAVFYQIYPRSFKDSDGDGIGDLKGITSKLQHLVNIGVTALWLSPIYKSPQVDTGYDISDFVDIDPEYGTLEDFDKLLNESHKLGLRVVLDYVPNHSSDQHEWFQKSIKRIDPYTNYYVWVDGEKSENGNLIPPNNWISEFQYSAWEWNEERGQYYLHQFAIAQPDLNYRDPNLVEEMKNVLRFWMDRGVDGFRVDTIPSLFENASLPDEPRSNDPNCLPTDHCYLLHPYTNDQPETYDMVVQWRNVLKDYSKQHGLEPKVIMTESYSSIEKTMGYYGNSTDDGASFTFNFLFITDVNGASDAQKYKETIDKWMQNLPEGRTPNWVLGNHDNHRVATRYEVELVDGLNMMTMSLPGVTVSYNGEEIGMEDGFVSWNDTQDPNALNAGPDRYLLFTRDPERTPFQWSDEKNAGFSTANHTWLPVSDKYNVTNVKAQKPENIESHYHVYQALTEMKKLETFRNGDLVYDTIDTTVLGIVRQLKNNPTFVTVLNIGSEEKTVDLTVLSKEIPKRLEVYVNSIGSTWKKYFGVTSNKVTLGPYEAYIFQGK